MFAKILNMETEKKDFFKSIFGEDYTVPEVNDDDISQLGSFDDELDLNSNREEKNKKDSSNSIKKKFLKITENKSTPPKTSLFLTLTKENYDFYNDLANNRKLSLQKLINIILTLFKEDIFENKENFK